MPISISKQTVYSKRYKTRSKRAMISGELTLDNGKRYYWSLTHYENHVAMNLRDGRSDRATRLAKENMRRLTNELMALHGGTLNALNKELIEG